MTRGGRGAAPIRNQMPTYVYECKECQERKDVRHSIVELTASHSCLECGGETSLVFAPATIVIPTSNRDAVSQIINMGDNRPRTQAALKKGMDQRTSASGQFRQLPPSGKDTRRPILTGRHSAGKE